MATHFVDVSQTRGEAFGGKLSNSVDISIREKEKRIFGSAVGPFFFGVVETVEETFPKLVE